MIVCNCNALNERKVDAAIRAGAKCWREVHAFHGCIPDCGSCEKEITERLQNRGLCNLTSRQTSPQSAWNLTAAE